MKVVIGSESFYPNVSGVAVTTMNLASHLAGKGHEVTVIVPSPSRQSYQERLADGLTVQRIGSFPNPFRRDFRVTFFPRALVGRILDQCTPDIIHLQDPASIGCALLSEAGKRRIPVVISHHFTLDYVLAYLWFLKPVHGPLRRWLTSRMIRFYNSCRYVITPSQTVMCQLELAGLKTRTKVISNGVDLNRFFAYEPPSSIRAALQLPNQPIVLYVGRIDPEKSLDTLIRAIPIVLARHKVHFVLCGGGNLLEALKKQLRKNGLTNSVTLMGPLEYHSELLPRIYQLATCFVIPSGMETQSIVTLEAMASGLPVVAARAAALPELVVDGDNGLLFRFGDDQDLAAKINLLLEDEEMRRQMGRRSLENVVRHELERSLNQIEAIYNEVVEEVPG
ncbi:glycosyltransferase [Candidatus Desulforudis audaxviator]|uniref:Glycosyl transferase, group 1 n=1 Tax=Desulforudis audaxviator (strain MP104C) TaxID=477974 RepID=B1I6E2_DESAP|nr:glycosyltransferase [Candidatus Desulforudis audaxviator]ACA60553.1 glycosyl transferase, group 1 [Candidatus Desulforudis audaxviator MP104C]